MAEQRPTIPALLERAATGFGSVDYLVTPTERMTFAAAEQNSARIARWLLARGVGKGTRVGLFFPNGAEWLNWWLAISRIGALAVPLSTLYRPAEIAKVLRLADVAMLIAPTRITARGLDIDVAERFEAALPGLAGRPAERIELPAAPFLRSVVLTGHGRSNWATRFSDKDAKISDAVLAAAQAEVTPADLAIMVHTSGSTADPKGVLHTHGTLVRQTSTWPAAIRAITGASADPVILCAMPFFWIGGVLAAMGALHEPVTLLTMPRLEAGGALDLIERERATGIVGWPAFTQQVRADPTFADRDLSSAPMLRDGPVDIAMTDVPDGFPVHRTMTETAGGFAYTDMAIVDGDGAPVPDGDVGELLIRGVGAMTGYNKRERAEVFDESGWYHTGDRVYRRAGDPRLFYVGRDSELIKAAGANVSPLEVEAVVTGLPAVAQCIVVGVDHPERGEEVCAVVIPASADFDLESIAAQARAQLSSYKVPTRWIVATDAQLPTLPSGKFHRKALQEAITDGSLG